MAGDVSTTLSAKEIKRLRQGVLYHKWLLAVAGLFVLTQFGAVASKLFQIHHFFPNITWSRICEFGFTRNFPVKGMYSGAEIRATSLAEDIFMHLCAVVIFVAFYFALKSIHRRNIILLRYIDEDAQYTRSR